MEARDWLNFAATLIAALLGGGITLLGVWLTIKHDEKKRKKDEKLKALENRPKFRIEKYSGPIRYDNSSESDLDVLLVKNHNPHFADGHWRFEYDKSILNHDNLVYFEYILSNSGGKEINSIIAVPCLGKELCLVELSCLEYMVNRGLINYEAYSSKRFIKPGEKFKLRVYYNNSEIIGNEMVAPISLFFDDSTGYYWKQPLFAPTNNIEDSFSSSIKEFKSFSSIDNVIEELEGRAVR